MADEKQNVKDFKIEIIDGEYTKLTFSRECEPDDSNDQSFNNYEGNFLAFFTEGGDHTDTEGSLPTKTPLCEFSEAPVVISEPCK